MLTFLWQSEESEKAEHVVFELRPSSVTSDPFEFEQTSEERMLLTEEGSLVYGYVFGMNLAEGVPEDRRRASYLHPVWGLDGEVMTDDFPVDHYHHRGIFWTWPQVFVGNDTLSLWDIRGIKQRFENWLVRETGPVYARLGVQNGWYTDNGRRVVDERVWITAYRTSGLGRIIDFELSWEAADTPVGIQGSADIKGYGGFSIRFAPFEEPVITTIGGRQTEDSNRLPFSWADFSARIGGREKVSGAAVFDHQQNIGFPSGWCLRHYGFTGIAWPGIEPFWLKPGQPLNARYRVWIHRGDAEHGRLPDSYYLWANPL